jgi:hypothetical protein
MNETDEHTRARVYKGLVRLQSHNVGFQMDLVDLNNRIHYEILQAYRLVVIRTDLAGYCSEHLIEDALKRQQSYAIDRVFYLLGLSYPGGKMASIQSTLASTDGRKKANALELIDTTVRADIKRSLLPILEGSEEQVLSIATGQLGLRRKEPEYWLEELIRGSNPWMTACALFEMGTRETQKLDSILQWSCKADNPLVRETALLALWRHQSLIRTKVNEESTLRNVNHVILAEGNGKDAMREEENRMEATLSTIERVLFLRGIDLFSELPGEEVAVIAQVCEEEYIPAGERFITQGDPGDRLYVIVDGEVIVEIEGVGEVARRHSRHIIGEMAIISDNPRSAHCTAVTDVTALSIQHDDFWDLMGERPKLSLGVIKVLSSLLDETVSQIYRLGL